MKIGFIGSGNMGSALASAAARASGTEVMIYDKDAEKAKAVAEALGASYASLEKIAAECDFVFLGVKPNIICSVADGLKDKLSEKAVVVSMAAGVKIAKIASHLKLGTPIIRIMPNTAVEVGEGMILYATNEKVSEQIQNDFAELLKYAGKLDKINEGLIDAASAVSGCGPAFVYMFINALADGGVEKGIPRDKALMYAEQTVLGAASLAIATGEHPEKLKDDVCSPGGTTIAGVHALEKGKMRASVMDAVKESYQKTLKIKK